MGTPGDTVKVENGFVFVAPRENPTAFIKLDESAYLGKISDILVSTIPVLVLRMNLVILSFQKVDIFSWEIIVSSHSMLASVSIVNDVPRLLLQHSLYQFQLFLGVLLFLLVTLTSSNRYFHTLLSGH